MMNIHLINKATKNFILLNGVINLVLLILVRFISYLILSYAFFKYILKYIFLGKLPKLSSIKGERKKGRKFMVRNELTRYVLLVSYILGVSSHVRSTFVSLGSVISEFWKKSGTINATKYWAEVYRLTLVYLSNERTRDLKTWVALTRSGLPKALPSSLRMILVSLKQGNSAPDVINIVRALFTVLCFFRGISGHHTPKYGSITDPFSGKSSTLPLDLLQSAVRSLGIKRFSGFRSTKYFIPQRAGANANLVIVSIGLDLLAMMDRPSIWLSYVRWCIKYQQIMLLFYFIAFSFILSPFYILYKVFYQMSLILLRKDSLSNPFFELLGVKSLPSNFLLGRLSIVKEARQKARVVGITDWWTQILLKPLHDYLSEILKGIPEDGTFDQSGPVNSLLFNKNTIGTLVDPIDSVDLSNATDRLPVNLQADILNTIGIDGDLWMKLLARDYYVPDLDKSLRYSVGQPMGAYSSFNMLALTNHVLNQVALNLAGVKYIPGTGQYAVLGDDVAIKVGQAASIYKDLLNGLGVETNPIKGFSGDIIEFAKRIYFNCKGKVLELSPIGSKSLVNSIRNPYYLVSVYLDLNKKSFVYDDMLGRLLQVLSIFYNKVGVQLYLYAFCILGPQGGLWPNPSRSNPDFTPLTVSGVNFKSVKGSWEDLVINILGLDVYEINGLYAWELQKLSAKPQSIYSELLKIFDELSLLTWVTPISLSKLNTYHKFSRYTLAIYTSLLAILISLPFVIKLTLDRFVVFVSVEVLKWNKVRRFGKQIPIPVHLHHLPELNPFKSGFSLGAVLDFFNSGMSSSNMFPYKGEEWLAEFNQFKELNQLNGDDPIRYFMWDYHYSTPFNVILDKISMTNLMDELSAMKMAKSSLCLSDHWGKVISDMKKAKVKNDKNRRNKRRGGKSSL